MPRPVTDHFAGFGDRLARAVAERESQVLLGLDPERLAFRVGGQEQHLDDGQTPGRIVRDLLANPPAV